MLALYGLFANVMIHIFKVVLMVVALVLCTLVQLGKVASLAKNHVSFTEACNIVVACLEQNPSCGATTTGVTHAGSWLDLWKHYTWG